MTMYHVPVLLNESINGLNINPDGIYIDATFGGGGHSKEILNRLSAGGRLFAIDQDQDAHKNKIDDCRLKVIFGNFRYLKNYLDYYKITQVDGILADLGISSHQIDEKDRGFSFRLGGNLDMRMNNEQTLTAAEILNTFEDTQIYSIFKNYCDIYNPGKLCSAIIEHRKSKRFGDINVFIELISQFAPKQKEIKYFAQVFQALRIAVNDEMSALEDFLNSLKNRIKTGGRLSVISYHSLEDILVKNVIRYGQTKQVEEINLFGNPKSIFKAIYRKTITPNNSEIINNSRAKSAKLRIAEKI